MYHFPYALKSDASCELKLKSMRYLLSVYGDTYKNLLNLEPKVILKRDMRDAIPLLGKVFLVSLAFPCEIVQSLQLVASQCMMS